MASKRVNEDEFTVTSLATSPPPFTRQVSGAVIAVIEGSDRGAHLTVGDEPRVIGSDNSCDLTLADPTLSRRHLEVVWRGDHLEVADLDSKNGSFSGGNRFHRLQAHYGGELRAGNAVFRIYPVEEEWPIELTEHTSLGSLIGAAPTMRRLFSLLDKVAKADAPVLIEGDTGVGKELVAEEIHRASPRRSAPFVVFDCAAVPKNLIEGILFGQLRGAFTGATRDRPGLFVEADGGTVFLDEIGELDLELQPALLRVVERGMVRPVGGTAYRKVDVRIVSATHRNLSAMIAEREFRHDLYYRLAVLRLSVPPLRERTDDVPLLIRHFLRRFGRPDLDPGDEVLAACAAYEWPGNVRELRNVVERGVALAGAGPLTLDVPEPVSPSDTRSPDPEPAVAEDPSATPGAGTVARKRFSEAKAELIAEFERGYLESLMAEYDSLATAAHAAGMDRKHLRTLLRRYELRD